MNKYIPLVYSVKINPKKVGIYLMQYEFIPNNFDFRSTNTYDDVENIKTMIKNNESYFERLSKGIRIHNVTAPSANEDWNEYAIQKLISNDLLGNDNVIVAYSTIYKDVITIRM